MATQKDYPTEAHRLIGMTHAELLADMAQRGLTKKEVLSAFDRVVDRATTRVSTRAAPEIVDILGVVDRDAAKELVFFEESVAAGAGSHSEGGEQGRSATLADLFGKQDWGAAIAVRVSGWSMRDAGIGDGDTILVDTRRVPKTGDIVLAHLAGQGQMVKRVRFSRFGPLALESANPDFEPLRVDDPVALTIHGVVVGCSRKM